MAKMMQTTRSNEANRTYSAHFEGIGVGAGKKNKNNPGYSSGYSTCIFSCYAQMGGTLKLNCEGKSVGFCHRHRMVSDCHRYRRASFRECSSIKTTFFLIAPESRNTRLWEDEGKFLKNLSRKAHSWALGDQRNTRQYS